MTKVIRWFSEDIRRMVGGVLTAVIITSITMIATSFNNIAIGAKKGGEAKKENEVQEQRLLILEECNNGQKLINYRSMKDIEYVIESVNRVEQKVDKMEYRIEKIYDQLID